MPNEPYFSVRSYLKRMSKAQLLTILRFLRSTPEEFIRDTPPTDLSCVSPEHYLDENEQLIMELLAEKEAEEAL